MRNKFIIYLYAYILGICLIIPNTVSAQSSENFTNDATLVSHQGRTAIILSSGIHEKKKEAVAMAILSAFDTYFFSGIAGLNDDMPLIGELETQEQKDYVKRIFKENRYTQFIGLVTEVNGSPEKMPTRQFKATIQFELKTDALYKDMLRSKVIKKDLERMNTTEIRQEIPQFTLTVVPFKPEGTTYSGILKNDYEIRNAITRIEAMLKTKKYEVKDFLAVVAAAERDLQFEMDKTVMSNDKQLINQTQADVYITVDLANNRRPDGGMGVVNLKAYEVSTGNLLSSAEGKSKRYRDYIIANLYDRALENCLDGFIQQLTSNWASKITDGNQYAINFAIAPESAIDMSTEVGSMGFPLADVLTLWIKKHAFNGKYHLAGSVDEYIKFDQVQIQQGQEQEFILSLYTYLRDELGISCNRRQSGKTYYITIQ